MSLLFFKCRGTRSENSLFCWCILHHGSLSEWIYTCINSWRRQAREILYSSFGFIYWDFAFFGGNITALTLGSVWLQFAAIRMMAKLSFDLLCIDAIINIQYKTKFKFRHQKPNWNILNGLFVDNKPFVLEKNKNKYFLSRLFFLWLINKKEKEKFIWIHVNISLTVGRWQVP